MLQYIGNVIGLNPKDEGEKMVPHITGEMLQDGPSNTLNELQILTGHEDIVRVVVKIDDFRVATAADDCKIIVWNSQTGKLLLTLEGHTRPITCMLLYDRHTLISGSSDRTIRLWDLHTGICEHTIPTAHQGSVQCLARLETEDDERSGFFCSGGNDQQLCVWKTRPLPSLVGTITRQDEETNLHCLLPIAERRIVTGSGSSYLFVYNTDTLKFSKVLAYHRDAVRCLVNISPTLFASGSLDGSVVVWQADTLTPLKILDYPDKFFDHSFSFAVNHMVVLAQKYLCAAIGRGFRVYDVNTGDCVVDCKEAHDASVLRIISLYKGTRIATCSADSSIKLWDASPALLEQRPSLMSSYRYSRAFGRTKATAPQAVCLGEMLGHSGAVTDIAAMSESSLVSCSADRLVILWKDGRVQSELRNRVATMCLIQQSSQGEEGPGQGEEGASRTKPGGVDDIRKALSEIKNESHDRIHAVRMRNHRRRAKAGQRRRRIIRTHSDPSMDGPNTRPNLHSNVAAVLRGVQGHSHIAPGKSLAALRSVVRDERSEDSEGGRELSIVSEPGYLGELSNSTSALPDHGHEGSENEPDLEGVPVVKVEEERDGILVDGRLKEKESAKEESDCETSDPQAIASTV